MLWGNTTYCVKWKICNKNLLLSFVLFWFVYSQRRNCVQAFIILLLQKPYQNFGDCPTTWRRDSWHRYKHEMKLYVTITLGLCMPPYRSEQSRLKRKTIGVSFHDALSLLRLHLHVQNHSLKSFNIEHSNQLYRWTLVNFL